MPVNKLKLNDDKTEALLQRSSSKSFSVSKLTTISVCGREISFSSSGRNLGFYIRDDISVELHIKNICRSAYSELHRISTIQHLLSVDSTKIFVSAFVLSRLDYCNSLLSGSPKHLLEKLQKVQNSAARLVLRANKWDHVSPLHRTLHWLPIQARMKYKLSTLCHSFFSDTAIVYLSVLLRVYSPSWQLRSSHQRWHERGTAHKERLPIGLLWTPPLLAQFGIFFQLTLQKHMCPP